MNNKKNYYEILKVSPLASPSAIKKAYQKLARIYHPDKNPNNPEASEIFKQINEAYQTLSDSFKRKKFDRQMKQEKQKEQDKKNKASFTPMYESYHSYPSFERNINPQGQPPYSSPSTPPLEEKLSTYNTNTQTAHSHKKDPFSIKNLKDYFKQPSSSSENQNYKPLEISLEEAALGCNKNISIQTSRKRAPQTELFKIYIPPGTKEKQIIKVNNKKVNENLYVFIVYKPHPLFISKQENILMSLPIPFTTAILGGEVQIPTLRGKVSFQLPAGVHAGHTIQLKGQGLPVATNSKKRGNMLITVSIDILSQFSEEEKNWIKKIQSRNQLCPKVAEFEIKTKILLKKRKT